MKKQETIGYAVTLPIDNYFIPDFTVNALMKNILQIHSDKKSADKAIKVLGGDWKVSKVIITIVD